MQSTRSTVTGRKGVVSSSHELASFWGARTLLEGGNVVDAAIATSAILAVVQNNMCGLGGDLFALVKLKGRIRDLNGSGRAASSATIDFYKSRGYSEIPSRGPLAALTVPGLVHAWGELSKFCTMELKDLLAPAIDYAHNGFAITDKYAGSIRASAQFLEESLGWRKIFMPSGAVPKAGYVLKQKDLAGSLRAIAEEGTEDFYNGDLAKKIASGIQEEGGVIALEDLKRHSSTWNENPISTDYRGVKVYETAPNSQAATVLLWLNMLEHFDLKSVGYGTEKLREILLDTCIKAYEERARAIGDPITWPLPPDFTSKKYAAQVLASERLDAFTSENTNATKAKGDTTYFCVADSEGNCLSVIQSNYMGFGSGLVPDGTGIVLHDRGCYFSLDRYHHNALAPGKRTFHTLCASMGERSNGETLFAIGSMGGDVQPQIHIQLMTQLLDFERDIQLSIDSPRWIVPITIYEKAAHIYTEFEAPATTRFHGLSFSSLGGYSSLTGHAQAILRTDDALFGAADHRGDGASVGF